VLVVGGGRGCGARRVWILGGWGVDGAFPSGPRDGGGVGGGNSSVNLGYKLCDGWGGGGGEHLVKDNWVGAG